MIRRDFILRQIEQFVAMLAKIAGFTKNEQWQEALTVTAGEFQRLTGMDVQEVVRDGVAGPVDPGRTNPRCRIQDLHAGDPA
jgi:hypothetical protein